MTIDKPLKAVLFDLDNTLFDHAHSLRSALAAIQIEYPILQLQEMTTLVKAYNGALESTYQKYLGKQLEYQNMDVEKVQLFFTSLGLPEPSPGEASHFRAIYKPAYRASRKATSGSIEMLVRLREEGYRLAIVTNGQKEDQNEKAQAIGVAHLVDYIVTSEEVGPAKPDPQIFQTALSALGVHTSDAYMVGDSIEADIKGGINTGLKTLLYDPASSSPTYQILETKILVLHNMSQLLGILQSSPQRPESIQSSR